MSQGGEDHDDGADNDDLDHRHFLWPAIGRGQAEDKKWERGHARNDDDGGGGTSIAAKRNDEPDHAARERQYQKKRCWHR